mgnify:CR=1 FL=1
MAASLATLLKRRDAAREVKGRAYQAYLRAEQEATSLDWQVYEAEKHAQPQCPHCGRKEHSGCLCPT